MSDAQRNRQALTAPPNDNIVEAEIVGEVNDQLNDAQRQQEPIRVETTRVEREPVRSEPNVVSYTHKGQLPNAKWYNKLALKIENNTLFNEVRDSLNNVRTLPFGVLMLVAGSFGLVSAFLWKLMPDRLESLFDLVWTVIIGIPLFIVTVTSMLSIVFLPFAAAWWVTGWFTTWGYRAGKAVRGGWFKRTWHSIKARFSK